jgi:hypothetical protein
LRPDSYAWQWFIDIDNPAWMVGFSAVRMCLLFLY